MKNWDWDECAEDALHDAQQLEECEHCGRLADHLYEVQDNDPSVGYYSTIRVCARCAEGRP